jgi:hypothetical protein
MSWIYFCRTYRKKQGHFWFWFLANHLRYFLTKALRKESNFFENTKKEIKTDLGTNSGANTGGSYNLEEFAITDEKSNRSPVFQNLRNMKLIKKL